MAQIEIDLIAKFGEYPLDAFDRFMLQTHVNDLGLRYSQDRVKQARSYLKSIFDEAIEQEFLVKDPTRKLKIPKESSAQGQGDSELGRNVVDPGKNGQARPPLAHAGYD
jgi:hypothetical protein